jgi:hypothetical protein
MLFGYEPSFKPLTVVEAKAIVGMNIFEKYEAEGRRE